MGYPGARQQRCRHAPSGLRQSPLQVSEPRTPYVLSLCSPLPSQAAWSRGGRAVPTLGPQAGLLLGHAQG